MMAAVWGSGVTVLVLGNGLSGPSRDCLSWLLRDMAGVCGSYAVLCSMDGAVKYMLITSDKKGQASLEEERIVMVRYYFYQVRRTNSDSVLRNCHWLMWANWNREGHGDPRIRTCQWLKCYVFYR